MSNRTQTRSNGRPQSRSDNAREANFQAGRALSELIRTTLGPKGMDKMITTDEGEILVTNNGSSILNRIDVRHPAASVIAELAHQQNERVSDGTTTVVVLAGELLSNAERLIETGVHPTKITRGYSLAASRAVETLEENTVTVDPENETHLRDVCTTVITGRWDEPSKNFLADRAIETLEAVRDGRSVNLEKVTRKSLPGGSYYDSRVVFGLAIDVAESSTTFVSPDEYLPNVFEPATVAIVDGQLTIESAKGQGTVSVTSPEQLAEFREHEQETYRTYADVIAGTGADVVFCQKSIDDPVRYLLARNGVLAVERTRRDELHELERTTGARAVANVTELSSDDTGVAKRIEREPVGSTELAIVTAEEPSDGTDGQTGADHVSLILRGGTEHVAEETKRIVDDCLLVLKLVIEEGSVLPGGGAIEMEIARELREYAPTLAGHEQLAVEAFGDALETIPRTIAESAGMDPIDAIAELRTRHGNGSSSVGIDATDSSIRDTTQAGVIEPLSIKKQAIAGAMEAATVLIRIDDVITASRKDDHHDASHDHDHDHGPGGFVESTGGLPWAVGHSQGHSH
ncbi:Chaperonin GroEL, HSP60 family [Halalkaliarchaeum sp. AArc-CO]|uniref:thermosome subunit alpha n=1 Tax=Halalkaliarchaeum sp. AArc-CO TaxID=2866381 RepID=UPI00217EA6A7|nr:thermosome subunit alpha [Halalkaliarchaeum sp. AArc-CO]UWG52222.1 Chaperonin GroEL, HSP60 family [Halalkaliarchaeum sp. AArc-CO]